MGPYKDQGDLLHVAVLGHLGVVVVDGVEAGLVLQAEDEDHGVDPRCELQRRRT